MESRSSEDRKVVLIAAKILTFLKNHWREVLIASLLLFVWAKSRHDYRQLQAAYEATQSSLEAQIEGLRGIHASELQARDIALQTYQERISELEARHSAGLAKIDETVTSRREEYVREFSRDKDSIASAIQQVFGFEYVE